MGETPSNQTNVIGSEVGGCHQTHSSPLLIVKRPHPNVVGFAEWELGSISVLWRRHCSKYGQWIHVLGGWCGVERGGEVLWSSEDGYGWA